jgi:hypothetical protein
MSLYQKASLVQIPSGTKVNKLYSVVPNNGDGDFTGTAIDGDATRINKDGLVEDVSTNVARLNYDPTNPQDPHLLIEPARTNRVFPNNSLTGYSTIGVTTSNNQTTAPNGANEGAKVQATTSGTAVVFKGFTGTSGVTHNISAFVKAGTHNQVRLQEGFSSSRIDVNLSTGTEVSSQNATNKKIEAYPNDWYRISFNFTSSSANLQFALYFNGSYTSGENVYLYGGQIEEGTYATSLIPTSGGILTRTEDNIYGAGDANLFNDTEGTLFVDVEPFTYEAVARITLSDSSTSDRIVIGTANSTQFRLLVIQGGAAPFRMDTFRNITYNTRNKIAITYKQNEYKLAINGTVVLTTTNTGLTPQGLNQLRFSDGDSGFKFRGKVFQTMVFNEALSNTELQELTSL